MSDLVKRLEAATGDSAELLTDCYHLLNGGKLFDQPASPNFGESYERWRRFKAMLNAEAYESAALTLVPEGAIRHIEWCEGFVEVAVFTERHSLAHGAAATPALAICIAALKAKEQQP